MTRRSYMYLPAAAAVLVALSSLPCVSSFALPFASSRRLLTTQTHALSASLAESSFGDAIPTVGGSSQKNKGDWQDGDADGGASGRARAVDDVHSAPVVESSVANIVGDSSDSNLENLEEEEVEEKYETNPASTTPQLLSALWTFLNAANTALTRGQTRTVLFPAMTSTFVTDPTYVDRLLHHLDVCKDVCDDFGVNTVLIPYTEDGKVVGFTAKSYRNLDKITSEGDYIFDDDPFWDDDEDWDSLDAEIAAIAAAEDDDDQSVAPVRAQGVGEFGEPIASTKPADFASSVQVDSTSLPEIENRVPEDDDEIITITKAWTQKMMADLGICPFTADAERSGMPMGPVLYEVDRSTTMEDVYEAYWKMVCKVEAADERELSTPLHIFPEFCLDNVEAFENFSNTLTQPLESLGVENLLQLVFFHPHWTFRDGGERSGMGSAANYARRSPWPMINILRTNQVRAAQKGIPTGLVYQQNEKTLNAVGTQQLETMLRKRDWSAIEDLRVNRRDMEALRIAQDYKETGSIDEKDRDIVHDATPAANRVDSDQLEGGDVVRVILQAMDKRLDGGADGGGQRLSGPETSAAMMASDFLLQRLDELSK